MPLDTQVLDTNLAASCMMHSGYCRMGFMLLSCTDRSWYTRSTARKGQHCNSIRLKLRAMHCKLEGGTRCEHDEQCEAGRNSLRGEEV